MNKLLLSAVGVLLALAGSARAETASPCPGLPADAGLTWTHTDGPDFVVCHAMRGKEQVFGVYLGRNPSYRHLDVNKAEASRIGSYEVTWYNVSPDDKQGAYARETMVRFGKQDSAGVAHFWISAASEEQLLATFKLLEGVSLQAPVAQAVPIETPPAVEAPATEGPAADVPPAPAEAPPAEVQDGAATGGPAA